MSLIRASHSHSRRAINDSAVVDSDTANSNTATLKYSQQTATDTVYVATYDFLLKKTDGIKYLPGSGFKLYGSETGDDQIKVGRDTDTGIYYVDPSAPADENILVDEEHGVNVHGLKPGTYFLEETVTPPGYNTLTGRQSFTITSGQTSPQTVTVAQLRTTPVLSFLPQAAAAPQFCTRSAQPSSSALLSF